MAILHKMIKLYKWLNEDLSDPRTKDLFLINSPLAIALLIVSYLYFVNVLGPKFMNKRQPYKLNRIIQIYNFIQIIINLYLFYKLINLTCSRDHSWQCQPVNYSYEPIPMEMTRIAFCYYLLKLFDLLDTVFFIFNKKQSHVSFLHVYHHSGMLMASWMATKYVPGGQSLNIGTVNTFVHVIVYTYYLLTSMNIYKTSWKKYITQLQLIQFCLCFLCFSRSLWLDCDYPVVLTLILIPQQLFMVILFGDFYYNTYVSKKPASAAASTKTGENDNLRRNCLE